MYKIPDFQRDYSWEINNWEDLWEDLLFLDKDKDTTSHYMGAIVLQNTDEKNSLIVVDGQQRMTTVTILIVAIIQFLHDLIEQGIEAEKNKERIEQIQRRFIGEKTISTLHYENKLKLNKNNNDFFQDRMLTRRDPIRYAKLKDSEKHLYDSYLYFRQKIKNKFIGDNGEKVGEFLENVIAEQLIFINITVDDGLSAYTVFETLNARGVDLTTTDLLKNYLFAISTQSISPSEMELLKTSWARIVDKIGLKIFPTFCDIF